MGEVKHPPLSSPSSLRPHHDVKPFHSGDAVMDTWLIHRAMKNEEDGVSRTFVVCSGHRVIGYYALSNSALLRKEATGRARRNMPNKIPAILLARLAVDIDFQNQGLAKGLVRDAVIRIMSAAKISGVRLIVVNAISEDVTRFYKSLGFEPSPMDPLLLMITLKDAHLAFSVAV